MRRTETGLLLLVCMAIALPSGCKPAGSAEIKSYLGLQAGHKVPEKVAPTFVALSDWFDAFTVGDSPQASSRYRGSMAGVRSGVPSAYHGGLIAYIDAELQRTSEYRAALQANDEPKLRALIKKECVELFDIIMVILNPEYEPETNDLFARFLRVTRKSAYVDRFAKDFEVRIFRKGLLSKIQTSLPKERDDFEQALTTLYLTDAEAKKRLADDLERNAKALVEMKRSLSSAGLDLTDAALTGGSVPLTGAPAAFMSYQSQYFGYAAANEVGDPPAPSFLSSIPDNPNDEPGHTPPPSSATSPTPGPLNGPQTTVPSNGAPASNLLLGLIPVDWFQTQSNLTGAKQDLATIIPPDPQINCPKLGVADEALIVCQRYYAYAQTKFTPRRIRPASGSFGLAAGGSNAEIVHDYRTPIIDQGSVPSCTAASLTGIMRTAAEIAGKSVMLDHEVLWNEQGQQPYMQGAQEAARTAFSSQGVTLTNVQPISSVDEMIAALDQKKMIHAGINLSQDWMAGGGGDEFQNQTWLNASGGSTQPLGCSYGGPGHAVAIEGYVTRNGKTYFITQNSWGADWGDQGYTLLDIESCLDGADLSIVEFAVQ